MFLFNLDCTSKNNPEIFLSHYVLNFEMNASEIVALFKHMDRTKTKIITEKIF